MLVGDRVLIEGGGLLVGVLVGDASGGWGSDRRGAGC